MRVKKRGKITKHKLSCYIMRNKLIEICVRNESEHWINERDHFSKHWKKNIRFHTFTIQEGDRDIKGGQHTDKILRYGFTEQLQYSKQ